ncbi:MAG: TolC family protein [Chlamydiota bacterium]|nr:TolC family protein [Chlamydiota bacterium]
MKIIKTFFLITLTSATLHAENLLNLEACQRIALDTNPIARAACEGVQIAEETVGIAESPYYPEIGLHAHYQRWQVHNFLSLNDTTGLIPPGTIPNIIGPTNDYNFSVQSSYTIYDWGKRRAQLMESLAEKRAACEEVSRVHQEILLNVSIAFYRLIAHIGLEEVAIKNLERAEKNHQLTQEKQMVGAAPLADVYRTQVEVAEGKQQIVKTQSLVRISKVNLNSAMGLPPNVEVDVTTDLQNASSPENIDLNDAQQTAIAKRPEIKKIQKQICALKYRVKGAESEFGPKFSAIGGYGKRDSDWTPSDDEWRFGVSMDVPLFTGFKLTHNLRRAKAEYCQLKAKFDRLSLDVQQQVWTAYSKLLESYQTINTAKVQVRDAKESMRLTEERYKAGAGIISDLLDAQTALTRAEATLVDAIWRYQAAYTTFIWTQGILTGE